MNSNIVTSLITTAGLLIAALIGGWFTLKTKVKETSGTGRIAEWEQWRKDNESLGKNLADCRTEIKTLRTEISDLRADLRKHEEGQERAESACRACLPLYEAALAGRIPHPSLIEDAGRELRQAGFLTIVTA